MEISLYPSRLRAALFVLLLAMINFSWDGWPRLLSAHAMQIILLPYSLLFIGVYWVFLGVDQGWRGGELGEWWSWRNGLRLALLFEVVSIGTFYFETRHYARLGYRLFPVSTALVFLVILGVLFWMAFRRKDTSPGVLLTALLGSYGAGMLLAIASFPITYLRSDMLFVIQRANAALLSGGNPYARFYVADRIYDFPYLPGMILAFTPAQALHLDLRFATLAYVVAGMGLVYWAARPEYRRDVAVLIGLFVLCPYVQYRHELYQQGYWFALIVIFVLMQRRKFFWSAVVYGISMTVLQFSWVIFPFFLMHGLRRGGWKEVGRMALTAGVVALAVLTPFHAFQGGDVAHNTVGQWDRAGVGVNARPINLSYWAVFAVRPNQLKWIQLAVLSAIFFYCWAKDKCADLTDTLRWMCLALLVFILLNILIDGYFYLVLLVLMLTYTCVANGWWRADGSLPIADGS